jgi:SAM-dependent methyltransferase
MPNDPLEPLDAVLARLKKERDEADARYNAALTALDRALRPAVALPSPAPGIDDQQVAALNDAWNILPAPPQASGLKGRLTGFIWGVVGPYIQRQLTFNSLLVDHINRSTAAQRDAYQAADAVVTVLREHLAGVAEFQSRLMLLLQQVTAYVDTRDRESGSGALVLNASISGLAENIAKRLESLAAREQRYEARTAAITAAHDDLRSTLGIVQHGFMTLKRQLETLRTTSPEPRIPNPDDRTPSPPPTPHSGSGAASPKLAPVAQRAEAGESRVPSAEGAFAGHLDAYKYVGFEDQFRGSREVIRGRLESYLPLFDGHADVLDVGCGRGEFLDLLAARGIAAKGIDLNHEMAEGCRARGLDVSEADAVTYLTALPDESLGGLFSAQVVEHLEPQYLLQFLELAGHKLRPGGRLVLETLNPACWVAFFESYIRDITHVWPLHPETLKYLVVASGFTRAAIEFRSPVPQQDRLQPIAVPAGADPVVNELAEAFNGNVEKLNSRIFTFLDYAVVADR